MGNKYIKHNKKSKSKSKSKNKGVAYSGQKKYPSEKTDGAFIWYNSSADDCDGHYVKNNCKCD